MKGTKQNRNPPSRYRFRTPLQLKNRKLHKNVKRKWAPLGSGFWRPVWNWGASLSFLTYIGGSTTNYLSNIYIIIYAIAYENWNYNKNRYVKIYRSTEKVGRSPTPKMISIYLGEILKSTNEGRRREIPPKWNLLREPLWFPCPPAKRN